MSSILNQADPEPGAEAYCNPRYLRAFGGPGVSPQHVRSLEREVERELTGRTSPSTYHHEAIWGSMMREYFSQLTSLTGASPEEIYSAREGFLGGLRLELEGMGLKKMDMIELGVVGASGGSRRGTSSAGYEGGRGTSQRGPGGATGGQGGASTRFGNGRGYRPPYAENCDSVSGSSRHGGGYRAPCAEDGDSD